MDAKVRAFYTDLDAHRKKMMFWIFGSLGGLGFVFMGPFLLAGVVYTLIKIYKPNDENVKTDKNHSQEGIIK